MPKRKFQKGTIIQSMDCTKSYVCMADLGEDGILLKGGDGTIFLSDRADITQVLGYRLDIKESALPADEAPPSPDTAEAPNSAPGLPPKGKPASKSKA